MITDADIEVSLKRVVLLGLSWCGEKEEIFVLVKGAKTRNIL